MEADTAYTSPNKKIYSMLLLLLLYCSFVSCVVIATTASVDDCSTSAAACTASNDDDTNDACCSTAATSGEDSLITSTDNAATEEHNEEEAEEGWCINCDWDELYHKLKCLAFVGKEKPVPTLDDYRMMRRIYEEVVGKYQSTILSHEDDGFLVPHRAGQCTDNPAKGRGIFATEFIPEGTQVFKSNHVAVFYSAGSARMFLSQLPSTLACDCLFWWYNEWSDIYEQYIQSVDLDDSALCNDSDNSNQQNIGLSGVAIKDIHPGDELVCLYSTFVGDDENIGATEFGLGWKGGNEYCADSSASAANCQTKE